MAKALTIVVEEDLYEELVTRAGGPRKISKYLNPLLRAALDAAPPDHGDLAALRHQVDQLVVRLTRLEREHAPQPPRIPPPVARPGAELTQDLDEDKRWGGEGG